MRGSMARAIPVKEHFLLMIVCCEKDCTDDEIRAALPPSGTTAGWSWVIREGDYSHCDTPEDRAKREKQFPVQCDKHPDRIHVMVGC